jgi:hypothetical protein
LALPAEAVRQPLDGEDLEPRLQPSRSPLAQEAVFPLLLRRQLFAEIHSCSKTGVQDSGRSIKVAPIES